VVILIPIFVSYLIEDTVLDGCPSTGYFCNQQFLPIMDFLLERL